VGFNLLAKAKNHYGLCIPSKTLNTGFDRENLEGSSAHDFPGQSHDKMRRMLNPWLTCHVIAVAKIEPDCQYLFRLA